MINGTKVLTASPVFLMFEVKQAFNTGADPKFLNGGGANVRSSIATEQRMSMISTLKY